MMTEVRMVTTLLKLRKSPALQERTVVVSNSILVYHMWRIIQKLLKVNSTNLYIILITVNVLKPKVLVWIPCNIQFNTIYQTWAVC